MLYLACFGNQLTTLDVSSNTNLTLLRCHQNQLSSLDVRNGNNSNFINFKADLNPNLICIDVDDPFWSVSNWTHVDAWTNFSLNCATAFGCTDSNYSEYDETATDDDGTCISLIGCLDTGYYEYNVNVVVSDQFACESKKGDANGDNSINLTDLFLVLDNWLQVTDLGQNGDVNTDGIVNLTDLFDVLDHWLQ